MSFRVEQLVQHVPLSTLQRPIVIPRALDVDAIRGIEERLEQSVLVGDPERRPEVLAIPSIDRERAGATQGQSIAARVQHHVPRRAAARDCLHEQRLESPS